MMPANYQATLGGMLPYGGSAGILSPASAKPYQDPTRGTNSDIATSIIQSGSSLGGAAMGGKGAKKAAQLQEQSVDKALAFQREQAQRERARYNQQVSNYQQQMAQYNAARNALLSRYGIW